VVREVRFDAHEQSGYGGHQVIVNPQSAHRVVGSEIDPHWHRVSIFSSNPLIDVEQVAVLLTNCFEPEPVNGIRKIQIDTLPVRPYAATFITRFLRVSRGVRWAEESSLPGLTANPISFTFHYAKEVHIRILDNATIHDFAKINCVSYDVPVETSLSLANEHTLWHEHAYGFVGYEDGKPVSTATPIINEGCLFLFLAATLPEARCKGYGEAVVRHALQRAYEETGISRAALHATEAGYPLYLRLGYHPTVRFMGCMLVP
jgi:GNAT superfamily N-acetyltransferase